MLELKDEEQERKNIDLWCMSRKDSIVREILWMKQKQETWSKRSVWVKERSVWVREREVCEWKREMYEWNIVTQIEPGSAFIVETSWYISTYAVHKVTPHSERKNKSHLAVTFFDLVTVSNIESSEARISIQDNFEKWKGRKLLQNFGKHHSGFVIWLYHWFRLDETYLHIPSTSWIVVGNM